MLEDLPARLGVSQAAASIENECVMIKACGGDLAKYLKKKGRRKMQAEKRRNA